MCNLCEKTNKDYSEDTDRSSAGGHTNAFNTLDSTFYIGSIKNELQRRLHMLKMEMDMVTTALSLCTDEAEKGVQLQRILDKLPKKA